MLLHTNEQQLAVNQARRLFDETEARHATAGVGPLIGNSAPIGPEAWRRIDSRVTRVQRSILAVFDRLARASTIPMGVGDIISYYPKITDSGEAHVSMDGRSSGLQDQANINFAGTPLPIVDSFSRIGWRQMEVLRKQNGGGLDSESVVNNARKVAEKLEDMAINGLPSIAVGGSTIYGLRTFPDRNTDTHGFTLASATGAQWMTAVGKVILALEGDFAFGPITIFLNYGDYSYISRVDYTTTYAKSILARLQEMGRVVEFVPAANVPANEMLGIADIDTGEWGGVMSAMAPSNVAKNRLNAQDDYVQGQMAICAPQFRSDANTRSRIAHVTQ